MVSGGKSKVRLWKHFFVVGATVPEIKVEVCGNCHPFYTGQMKYVDTAGRVEAFKAKQKGASEKLVSKKEKDALRKSKGLKKNWKDRTRWKLFGPKNNKFLL